MQNLDGWKSRKSEIQKKKISNVQNLEKQNLEMKNLENFENLESVKCKSDWSTC